jgi:hypothetical protein
VEPGGASRCGGFPGLWCSFYRRGAGRWEVRGSDDQSVVAPSVVAVWEMTRCKEEQTTENVWRGEEA